MRNKRVTVVRELVYEGPEDWLDLVLSKAYVPVNGHIRQPHGATITSKIVKREVSNGPNPRE